MTIYFDDQLECWQEILAHLRKRQAAGTGKRTARQRPPASAALAGEPKVNGKPWCALQSLRPLSPWLMTLTYQQRAQAPCRRGRTSKPTRWHPTSCFEHFTSARLSSTAQKPELLDRMSSPWPQTRAQKAQRSKRARRTSLLTLLLRPTHADPWQSAADTLREHT